MSSANVKICRVPNDSPVSLRKTLDAVLECSHAAIRKSPSLVVIKPNLHYYWDASTGRTTDPRVVGMIVDYLRDNYGSDVEIVIAEADASAMQVKYAFQILGYTKLACNKRISLVSLSKGDIVEKEVSVGNKKFALKFSELLFEADALINVPSLKYHKVVGVSCCLKNIFGSIATKYKFQYHRFPVRSLQRLFEPSGQSKNSSGPNLFEAIVGANKIIRPSINVVDGLVAAGSCPVKLGTLIAGSDSVAVDSVAATIVGAKPGRIAYLRLAAREGLGQLEPIVDSEIPIESLVKTFPRQDYRLQEISWSLQIKALRFYARLVGDTIPPVVDWSS